MRVSIVEGRIEFHQRMTLIDAGFSKRSVNQALRTFVHERIAAFGRKVDMSI
ncbi:hypothetical protein AQB9606_03444 [Aquabacterium sp. CECT 9606]|nr:hypothetical protein AQB9606_03444 [Aquabacterium sp. CECT 9606]